MVSLKDPTKAQLRLWRSLAMEKYRRREGLCLTEGFKVVSELIRSPWEVRGILVMEEKRGRWESFLSGLPERTDLYVLGRKDWNDLSQDRESEGIMAVAAVPVLPGRDPVPDTLPGHLLLLHEIANPGNLGSILRTAHWFGIGTVLLSRGSVDFTHPKVVRSSMGSLFHLKVLADLDFPEAIPGLKANWRVVGSDVAGGLPPHPCTGRTALLLGSESHGLPERLLALTDERWHIPGAGGAESLSLPQAAAILIYGCTRQAP